VVQLYAFDILALDAEDLRVAVVISNAPLGSSAPRCRKDLNRMPTKSLELPVAQMGTAN
jgi:hypothetical protein